MRLAKDAGRRAKYRFKCACGTKTSIRKGYFFENSKLSIIELKSAVHSASYVLLGRKNHGVEGSAVVLCLPHVSVSQWYQYLCEKCSKALLNDPNYKFVGIGVVVQIDESVVARRKYNVGHAVAQQWVFGLYDTTNKRGRIQLCRNIKKGTLHTLNTLKVRNSYP